MNLIYFKAELRLDEGVRYVVYTDSKGIPTWGVGHNCLASPLDPSITFPSTDEMVETVLDADIAEKLDELQQNDWWIQLDEVRQRAIANLCFNLGWEKLSTFYQFLALVQQAQWIAAAADLHKTPWFAEVGSRGPRIVAMIQTGVSPYPESIYPADPDGTPT